MTTFCKACVSDDDFAKVSLFILNHKRDLHPSFSTTDMVTLIYSYVTQGRMIYTADADDRVIGAAAYYIGTPEQEFQDKEVALVDMAISDRAYRGSRLFIKGLRYMVGRILEEQQEVQEFRLAALAENDYLCKLYSKFTSTRYTREGAQGKEIVFCEKIYKLRTMLNKFQKV
jgi:hypothetical protein